PAPPPDEPPAPPVPPTPLLPPTPESVPMPLPPCGPAAGGTDEVPGDPAGAWVGVCALLLIMPGCCTWFCQALPLAALSDEQSEGEALCASAASDATERKAADAISIAPRRVSGFMVGAPVHA